MKPYVVAIEMGYGHLRAAAPLCERLGCELLHCDRAPLADERERRLWAEARRLYEFTSRVSQVPTVGQPLRRLLEVITDIPHLHPYRDLSSPSAATRFLQHFIDRGLGRGLSEVLVSGGQPLLTTFFAPALAADQHGAEVYCVVTDADINRVWAPHEPHRSRIRYFAPSMRVVRRLQSYGIKPSQIVFTGFPLPHELLGGPSLSVLRQNLVRRLARLDRQRAFFQQYRDELEHFLGPLPEEEEGRPPHLMFAVGGAGAQTELVRRFLPRMQALLRSGRLRLTLVAGVRPEVSAAFCEALHDLRLEDELGRAIEILYEPSFDAYYRRFNACLAASDILWTKPSEMTFYAALGLGLVFCPPIGVHEDYNRRWAIEAGAGLRQRDPRYAAEWLSDWLDDGTLAGVAFSGFLRLPKFGLYRILEELGFDGEISNEARPWKYPETISPPGHVVR